MNNIVSIAIDVGLFDNDSVITNDVLKTIPKNTNISIY